MYSWMRVLAYTHSYFKENNIHVDESDNAKCAVASLENQIRNGVHYMESERAESVDDNAVGDRFGEEKYKENLAVPIVAKSAVLKDMDDVDLSVKNAAIEAMISMLNKNAADTDEPPLVTVRRGEEPVTEWNYIGEMIAAAFPRLCMKGG
ncbi:hypothetical protein PC118_g5055 [Phytophthora cactorum]|uniref:Uncharacterized protein n=1 Tax=Phytophthora cactorum TaxID=29920 RepID=A0A329SP12_9STRA|nr:hypothetical protein PC111_g17751 [Phytophthora cactorum]KAG2842915.1 hypothetical protein PC113_g18707 [Phytophthora cactorum]KAG2991555.1 hypothetical protein PC118_g5055 [Phytophthora cactorum]KAG3064530.1 hypothetical protein PC122_g18507 [Phytophthora cactorum]KAG4051393.1 hypothetical protein PC123_g13392 [Phytophthora cactorum]